MFLLQRKKQSMQKKKDSRKHFTFRQRLYIEVGLIRGTSIQEMANHLRFSRQSIYREIINNSFLKQTRQLNIIRTDVTCEQLLKYPFVCNECKKKQYCTKVKRYYHAEQAHEKATLRLSKSRSGTRLTKGEILVLEEALEKGLNNGLSLHHIMTANKEKFTLCERSVRNLINRGELKFRNIDLPMTVRFNKPIKQYNYRKNTHMPEVLLGRTYADFRDYVSYGNHYAQIDSVIGKQSDKKTIITIMFPTISFIFGFLSTEKGWLSVNNGLLDIASKLGLPLFSKVFPVILSDRGIEFNRLYLLENFVDDNGLVDEVTKVFYCDPYTSNQRAELESNHRLIRRILPKKTSFEFLTQEHLDLMFSHINGLIRPNQNDKTGYELAKAYLGLDFLNAINISYVAPNDVILNRSLFNNLKKND